MRSRLVITTLLVCLAGAAAAGRRGQAWSNGDDHGNGFGTHDWVLQEADRLAAKQNAGWVKLSVALPKTDDPDTVFHDTYYHVYDVWGASTYGDAPKKVAEYYGKALAARKAGDWTAASKYVGLMAHYYADICNPIHTDQTDAEDRMHSPYETDDADVHRRGGGEPRLDHVRRPSDDRRGRLHQDHGERRPPVLARSSRATTAAA